MKWPNIIQKYTTPPIKNSDRLLPMSNQEKQQLALRAKLLILPTSPFQPYIVELVDFYFDSRNNAIE